MGAKGKHSRSNSNSDKETQKKKSHKHQHNSRSSSQNQGGKVEKKKKQNKHHNDKKSRSNSKNNRSGRRSQERKQQKDRQRQSSSSSQKSEENKLIQSSGQKIQQQQPAYILETTNSELISSSSNINISQNIAIKEKHNKKNKKSKSKKSSRSRSPKERKKKHHHDSDSDFEGQSKHSKLKDQNVYTEKEKPIAVSTETNQQSQVDKDAEKQKKLKMRLIKARALRFEKDENQFQEQGTQQGGTDAMAMSGANNFKLDINQVLSIYMQPQVVTPGIAPILPSGVVNMINPVGVQPIIPILHQNLIGNANGGNGGSLINQMPAFSNIKKTANQGGEDLQQMEDEKGQTGEKRKPVFVDSDGLEEDDDDEDDEGDKQGGKTNIGKGGELGTGKKKQGHKDQQQMTLGNQNFQNKIKLQEALMSTSQNIDAQTGQHTKIMTENTNNIIMNNASNQSSNNNVQFNPHRNSTQKVDTSVPEDGVAGEVEEDDDPLDSFMRDIKKDAVKQEQFNTNLFKNGLIDKNFGQQNIVDNNTMMDEQDETMIEHKFDASKAITLEEILGKKNKSPIATGGQTLQNQENADYNEDIGDYKQDQNVQQYIEINQDDNDMNLLIENMKRKQKVKTNQQERFIINEDDQVFEMQEDEEAKIKDQTIEIVNEIERDVENKDEEDDDDDEYYRAFQEQMKKLASTPLTITQDIQKNNQKQKQIDEEKQKDEVGSEDKTNASTLVVPPDKKGGFIMDEEEDDNSDSEKEVKRGHKGKSGNTNQLLTGVQGGNNNNSSGQGNSNANNNKNQGEEEQDDYFAKQKKIAEKKELKPVDHTSISYLQFRKEFYIECKEIKEMTEEQVKEYRKQLGEINVRGKEVPKPIQNWYQCGLSDAILNLLLTKKKYLKPFPIQCQAIPVIMKGRDTIGIAETGSGKTLAYILPMLRHVIDQPGLEEGDGPIGLIIAPTRELAHQIFTECKTFAKSINLNVVCVYGGAGIGGQLSELKKGAEIVVGTPGRLIDLLTTSGGKIINLRRVTFVVLDEADRMLDQGFEPQISKILGNVRPDRQTVMFSATFPKNVEALAKRILLNRPVEIVVGARGQACTNITQVIEIVEESQKLLRLLAILGEWKEQGSILIFVDRQTDADELFKELLKYGYWVLVLHGGMDATDREFTIYDFKKGVATIMVATSVCARGLDIKSIVLVVNFSCPNHLEDYIHRIGRTGRAGNRGTAITFITQEQDMYVSDIIKALHMSNQTPSQQLLDMAAEFKKKVEKGEAKQFYNRNLVGTGYKFDENESRQARETKKAIRRRFGIELDISDGENSDEEDIFVKKEKRAAQGEGGQTTQQQGGAVNPNNPHELSEKEKLNMIKDPNIRNSIMQEGYRAAIQALTSGGKTQEQVLEAASASIKKALEKYKPSVKSVDQGIMEASQLIETFQKREEENMEIITYDFEINDYPANARQKVMNKEFLNTIHDLTNCNIAVRGQHFEPNKKVPPGQKKLYLHIEGDSKYYVTSAYREIKRVIEEAAMKNLTIGGAQPGRFKM